MQELRIGINALYLIPGGVGGTEIYLRSLLSGLAAIDRNNQYVVFTNRETGLDIAPAQSNFTIESLNVRAAFRPGRIVVEQTSLLSAVRRSKLDVLLNAGFTAPLLASVPCVTVFHDLQHKRHPEFFRWFDLPFWCALLYGSAHRATRLIAVSEATRQDLLRFYKLDPAKIAVIPHGVDPKFFDIARERRQQTAEPLVLCVSTLHPHKNLERLIRVFARLRAKHPAYRLTIAGLRGFHTEVLERLVESLAAQDFVRLTGWIPREELYGLFRRAAVFVYPSTFEGFGMPVLEALAAGLPTSCSSVEPMPSVAGGAALYFDPNDDDALLDALLRLIEDPDLRCKLQTTGPERASGFTWSKAAERTLSVIRDAAQRR
jgi:glycosyltransferase involved in cell wall biosynthesis